MQADAGGTRTTNQSGEKTADTASQDVSKVRPRAASHTSDIALDALQDPWNGLGVPGESSEQAGLSARKPQDYITAHAT